MSNYDPWLEKFHAKRPFPIGDLAEQFEKALANSQREEDMQTFFTENPFILAEQLPHCHHVIPKFSFGGKYISDFLLPEMASSGTTWVLVELEPVNAKLVTASGQLADRLRGGIQQVKDWRDWLLDNRDQALRPRRQNGLGFENIEDIRGWVIVGRRSEVSARFNQLRNQVQRDSKIDVMTYDRLLEWFKKRAEHWEAWDRSLSALASSRKTDL